jgi:hypothetical protein
MEVSIDPSALLKDTSETQHGPCEVCLDPKAFLRQFWKTEPSSILPISRDSKRLLHSINKILGYPLEPVVSTAFLSYSVHETDGISRIYINPQTLVKRLLKTSMTAIQIYIAAKAFMIESYQHERSHIDQKASELKVPVWTDPSLKVKSRILIGLFDIAGVGINLACLYGILHSDAFSTKEQFLLGTLAVIGSAFTTFGRDQLYDHFQHQDDPKEIEAHKASSCPLQHPVFHFKCI